MTKSLYAVIFCVIGFSAFSQHVSVHVKDTTHVHDSIDTRAIRGRQAVESVSRVKNAIDSLNGPDGALPLHKIYSERHLKYIKDSIERATGFPIPEDVPLKTEVSEADMLKAVNNKFPSVPSGPPPGLEDYQSGIEEVSKLKSGFPAVPSANALPITDPSSLQLPAVDRMNLPPLPGNVVKSKYLNQFDSIRKINLKEERLDLKEQRQSAQSKLAIVQGKPKFWDKSYFEGVVGVTGGKDFTIYQASPAMGYHFTDYFSVGLGPTLQIQASGKKFYANGALRTFSKFEFFQRQLYMQVEDAVSPYSTREKLKQNIHNIYVGGGVLLSMKAPLTLNLSLLYNVNKNKFTRSDITPFVFRLGISTIKMDK